MTTQKADLRKAMLRQADPARNVESVPAESTRNRTPHYRPGREGKTNVTGFFPPAVKKQLRLMAAESDTTIQALLAEALNDLFAKHGRAEIAPR